MSRMPVVRQISWPAVLLQLAALGGAVALGTYVTQISDGGAIGAAAYLSYSIGSRLLIARAHRRGMRFYRNQQYAAAIEAYQESYDFFARNTWIDQYRAIVMMSPSAVSYREMALCNIAFCFSQLGNGAQAEAFYRRALDEFPSSGLAAAALRMIDSAKQRPAEAVAAQ